MLPKQTNRTDTKVRALLFHPESNINPILTQPLGIVITFGSRVKRLVEGRWAFP